MVLFLDFGGYASVPIEMLRKIMYVYFSNILDKIFYAYHILGTSFCLVRAMCPSRLFMLSSRDFKFSQMSKTNFQILPWNYMILSVKFQEIH